MPRLGTVAGTAAKAARYKVLDGYPVAKKFESVSEIKAYLHAPEITCLLCGKSFKALVGHLHAIHGMATDAYKEMYGLPYSYGLVSTGTHELIRERALTNPALCAVTPDLQRMAAAASRRSSSAHILACKENGRNAPPYVSPFTEIHGYEILKQMRDHGASLRQAVESSGIMKMTAFWNLLARYPDLANEYEEVRRTVDRGMTNPLTRQVEVVSEVRRLFAAGVPRVDIAKKFDIHVEYVSVLNRGWRTRKQKERVLGELS